MTLQRPRWRRYLLATAQLIIALAGFSLCAFLSANSIQVKTKGGVAQGEVIDASQHQKLRFRTAKGDVVVFTQNGFFARRLGEKVAVLYDPHDPEGTAVPDTFACLWLPGLWGLPFSLVFLANALASLTSEKQKSVEPPGR